MATDMNYFHGRISAKTAETRLLKHKTDNEGLYLLRERQGGRYIISYVETQHKDVGHILVPTGVDSKGQPLTSFLKNNPQLRSVQDILEFISSRCSGRIKMQCPLSKDEFKFDNDAVIDLEEDGLTCYICDLKVSNKKAHIRSHYVHYCQHCDKVIHQNSVKNHEIDHSKNYHCVKCNFKTNYEDKMTSHIQNGCESQTYHCPLNRTICNFKTICKDELTNHIKTSHFSCDRCDRVFRLSSKLEIHKAKAHGDHFKCPSCGKLFPSLSNRNRHLAEVKCVKPEIDTENDNEKSKSASINPKHHGTLEMWEQVTGLRWEEVTEGGKVDHVEGETLKQMYEDQSIPQNPIESSEENLSSERDPRVVTFEEIVKMSGDGGWDDVTIICADGKFKSSSFLLATMFPVIRSVFSDVLVDDDVFISLPDVSVAHIQMFFQSVHQKNSIIRVGDGISQLLGSKLQCLGNKSKSEVEYDYHNDHDYLDNGGEDVKQENINLVRIKFRKKPIALDDEFEDIMNKICEKENSHIRLCVICRRRVRRNENTKIPRFIEDEDGFKCRKCSRKQVPCELCGKMLSLRAMRKHMKLHGEKQNRQCFGECGNPECRKIFEYPSALRRHQEKNQTPQTCHICGYIGKSVSSLKSHLLTHDSTRSRCPHCSQYTPNDRFEEHKKECRERRMCVCNICGTTFNGREGLQSHIRKWHDNHKPKHKCGKCNKTFIAVMELKRHMVSHEDKTSCPECGLKVRHLKLHIEQVHTPDDQKPFQCQDCGKGFVEKRVLEHHRMNVHLKLRPYNCRYGCDIAYNDTSNRNQHEKKTHGKLFTTEREEKVKFFNAVT